MVNLFESYNFAWFCFGLIMFIANFTLFILKNHLIKINSVDEVNKLVLHKNKLPVINMVFFATVCISNILDYFFYTNLFIIDLILWFLSFLVLLFSRIFCKRCLRADKKRSK